MQDEITEEIKRINPALETYDPSTNPNNHPMPAAPPQGQDPHDFENNLNQFPPPPPNAQ